jgi:hypothetical protein
MLTVQSPRPWLAIPKKSIERLKYSGQIREEFSVPCRIYVETMQKPRLPHREA